jgi:acyl-coenzyme A thioesterase PaaI-like protein
MEQPDHPGDIDRHIMRDLGFSVGLVGAEMHGSALVVPEMWVPGSDALRMGILAAWVDMVAGHLAIDLFTPSVPVTLDLDVHLHRQATAVDEVRMVGRTQKAGRSVAVLSVDIEADGSSIGFAHATFMAAPNPSLKMPTIVSDEGLLEPHPAQLSVPFAERAGCEQRAPGLVEIPMRPDGLNAAGTLNGGLLALAVEEAALTAGNGRPLTSMSMRFASPVRIGPGVASAQVIDGLGNVEVRDEGRDGRLAVIATTRAP